jgi:hypothetical protein
MGLLMICIASSVRGQNTGYEVQYYSSTEGLSNLHISAILQHSDGFMDWQP